ncbi:J domain-containing protein [Elstera cyanobacteriorum]|uniref:J domain-containing protein n=1 Tax=Elstera cyanobacteriorum TaxID=2022747 RepID=UPI0023564B06|nr:J domain-containing protein [Elstera cyanobacteriorum]MCK6441342.1 J domain-containing protein [Elstera cyanobacteriorum]
MATRRPSRFTVSFFDEIDKPPVRPCDHAGCPHAGEFRAPKSRSDLNSYYWFCLDHVREYNLAWNYYAGMSPEEIEAENRTDATWNRPTWPFGQSKPGGKTQYQPGTGRRPRFTDGFGFFEDDAEADRTAARGSASAEETKAMAIFNLSHPITLADVKTRYKELVKRHHPDANGGDKQAEERIKVINQAYTVLRAFVTE